MKNIFFLLVILFFVNSYAQCFKTSSAGSQHSLSIHNNGSLYAWGKDESGEVGYPLSNLPIFSPVQITNENDWKSVFTGSETSFAIKNDGTLWVWGEGNSGGLGLGGRNNAFIPTQLGFKTDWNYITSKSTTIAIKIDGSVWGWGSNITGQLGIGKTSIEETPLQINTETDWKSIITLGLHTLAIKNNGTLWGTGKNVDGSLGDGTDVDKLVFTQIGTDTNWVQVAGGLEYSLGLKADGTIWGWGRNYFPFQNFTIFGNQYPSRMLTPTSLSSDNTWVQISGSGILLGLKSNGTLWDIRRDIQIGTESDWDTIYAGGSHSLITKTDDSLWSHGSNSFGQLGVGSGIQSTTIPLKIDCSTLKTENLSINKTVEIYPNPTSQKIFIKNKNLSKNLKFTLTDLNGKILFETKNSVSEINLERFSKGIYLLNVENKSEKQIFKIMKE
jgi:hypothetical protein